MIYLYFNIAPSLPRYYTSSTYLFYFVIKVTCESRVTKDLLKQQIEQAEGSINSLPTKLAGS